MTTSLTAAERTTNELRQTLTIARFLIALWILASIFAGGIYAAQERSALGALGALGGVTIGFVMMVVVLYISARTSAVRTCRW